MLVYKYTMDRPFTKVREASIIIGIKGNCLIMSDNLYKAIEYKYQSALFSLNMIKRAIVEKRDRFPPIYTSHPNLLLIITIIRHKKICAFRHNFGVITPKLIYKLKPSFLN